MEKRIQETVKYLDIPNKKRKVELNRGLITSCNASLSDMTSNQVVAQYAYDLDQLVYLVKENNPEKLDEIKRLRKEIDELEYKSKEVREYKFVLEYRSDLEKQISDYYKTIQVDLRNELMYLTLPDIFVSQGPCVGKHIIVPGTYFYTPELADFDTLIVPEQMDLTSARNSRHLYNQVSFRYLEQLTEDYSYDVENKDLGNVKVLRRGQ